MRQSGSSINPIIKCLLAAAILVEGQLGIAAQPATGAASKPNILVILDDDLGYGDVQGYRRVERFPRRTAKGDVEK